jgi:hypothetical protein
VPASYHLAADDLLFLKELDEARLLKAFIGKRYPLEQIVDARRCIDEGYKRRNVVLAVVNDR